MSEPTWSTVQIKVPSAWRLYEDASAAWNGYSSREVFRIGSFDPDSALGEALNALNLVWDEFFGNPEYDSTVVEDDPTAMIITMAGEMNYGVSDDKMDPITALRIPWYGHCDSGAEWGDIVYWYDGNEAGQTDSADADESGGIVITTGKWAELKAEAAKEWLSEWHVEVGHTTIGYLQALVDAVEEHLNQHDGIPEKCDISHLHELEAGDLADAES